MLSKEEIENSKKRLQKRYDTAENYIITQVFLTEDIHAIGIFLKYVEQLERTIKIMSEEQTHKQDNYCKHYCNAMIEYKNISERDQKLIEKLEELKQQYKEILGQNNIKAFILKCQIEILQELLEGK